MTDPRALVSRRLSVELPLYRYGRLARATTLVDDDVAEELEDKKLVLCGGYVFLGIQQLHRLITGCTRGDGLVVHHLSEDPTDNRRVNLKVCAGALDHGSQPHPWRDRISSLVQHYDGAVARAMVAYERECAGLRSIGGEAP